VRGSTPEGREVDSTSSAREELGAGDAGERGERGIEEKEAREREESAGERCPERETTREESKNAAACNLRVDSKQERSISHSVVVSIGTLVSFRAPSE